MTILAKLFIGAALTCAAGVCATGGLVAYWIGSAGWIGVEVESSDGTDLGIHVPAAIADVAAWAIPDAAIEEALDDEARREIAPLLPTLRDMQEQLEDSPDFVLFEGKQDGEFVRVAKRGRNIVVEVDGRDDRVKVQVPLSAMRTVRNILE